jgi:hypothetical protein
MKVNDEFGRVVDIKVKDLRGRKIRTTCPMRTSVMKIPRGTVATIYGAWRGMVHFETEPCKKCGVVVSVRQVPKCDFVLLI